MKKIISEHERLMLKLIDEGDIKQAFLELQKQGPAYFMPVIANIAESVLHIFERIFPYDKRPRQAILAIKLKWLSRFNSAKAIGETEQNLSRLGLEDYAASAEAARKDADDAAYHYFKSRYDYKERELMELYSASYTGDISYENTLRINTEAEEFANDEVNYELRSAERAASAVTEAYYDFSNEYCYNVALYAANAESCDPETQLQKAGEILKIYITKGGRNAKY